MNFEAVGSKKKECRAECGDRSRREMRREMWYEIGKFKYLEEEEKE
jgi:hypothetical protein